MGGKDHSNSDGSFAGDSPFSVSTATGRFTVLQGPTNLPGRISDGLCRPDPGDDGFRPQNGEFNPRSRLDQAKLAI
jgi:hypothetical protein